MKDQQFNNIPEIFNFLEMSKEEFLSVKTDSLIKARCCQCSAIVEKIKRHYIGSFRVKKRQNGNINTFYCSKQCAGKSKFINRINCKCVNCNKDIQISQYNFRKKENRFCSHSCAAKYSNKGRVSNRTRNFFVHICCFCKKTTKVSKFYEKTKKFCSNSCFHKNHKEQTIKRFLQGYNVGVLSQKQILRDLRGDKCELCGQLPFHNNQPLMLQLDHIDGNSDNGKSDNLRLLCPNCHAQTPTYKSRNKNTTRAKYARFYRKNILQKIESKIL